MTDEIILFGPFSLFKKERLLLKDGTPVAIGGRALDLLITLTERPGEIVAGRELLERVWSGIFVEESNLRFHIALLRKALDDGKGGRYVVNIPRRGYSFVAPLQSAVADADSMRSARADATRLQNLPAMPHLLVGRDEAVAALAALLLSRRFVSIIGAGGVGKTTVAIAVAHAVRQQCDDLNVCLVDLGSINDSSKVSSAIAAALGCLGRGVDPEPNIRAFAADKRLLIVLDNCEHLIEAIAPLTERLFRDAPSLSFLTTSREALRAEGESLYQLESLSSPCEDTPSADAALASSAVQLFMKRAALGGHRAELSDEEAPVVADICRRLDGLALAIELVASRVGTLGMRGTANLMISGAELTVQGRRSALPRHQTLQAMLDWSFGLLSQQEQDVLCQLSVFVGTFTIEAAQAIASDGSIEKQAITKAILSLGDKSLIQLSSTRVHVHCRLLDTTRAYAAAKLADLGQTEATLRRHAQHFLDILNQETADGIAFKASQVAKFVPLLGNVRKALAWAFSASGDRGIGMDLAAQAAPLLLAAGLITESRELCARALQDHDNANEETSRTLVLQTTLATASMYAGSSSEQVITAIKRALRLSEALNDTQSKCHLLGQLNICLCRIGSFRAALSAAEQCLAVARSIGGAAEMALGELMYATTLHFAGGSHADALHHCGLGFALASAAKDTTVGVFAYDHRLVSHVSRARCLWLLGSQDQAVDLASEVIREAYQHPHPVRSCIGFLYASQVLLWSGKIEEASRHIDVASQRAREYSLSPYVACSLALKGEIKAASGQIDEGVEMMRDALEAMRANQYNILTLSTSRALADGLGQLGRLPEAMLTIDEAVAEAGRTGAKLWVPELWRTRGELLLLAHPSPHPAASEAALLCAIEEARKQQALSWELRAAVPLARIWKEQGRNADARSLVSNVYDRFTEGFAFPDLRSARELMKAMEQ